MHKTIAPLKTVHFVDTGFAQNAQKICALNDLCIMNTFYKHKKHRLVIWISPDGKTQNQIDFFLLKQSSKSNIKNCRVYNSADNMVLNIPYYCLRAYSNCKNEK